MPSGLKRSETLIGTGLVMGLVLVFYGANRLSVARAQARTPEAPVAGPSQFVVAARPIVKGRAIEAADLTLAQGPAPAGVLTGPDAAVGRIALADIPVRQPVSAAALARTGPGGDLASQIPIGYRAISIQTTDEIAVSNLLRPGDLVDIQVVLGDPLLAKGGAGSGEDRSEAGALIQKVRVVSVGDVVGAAPGPATTAGPRGGPPVASRTLALAMTPAQIARFTLARSLGTFYLSLRNPADRDDQPAVVARLADLRAGTVSSPAALAATAAPRPVSVRRPAPRPAQLASTGVELVVGGERQTIFPQ
jgi:pilus assembly protein CpaB